MVQNERISIGPNPASSTDELHISSGTATDSQTSIEVYDINGIRTTFYDFSIYGNNITLTPKKSESKISTDLYFIRIGFCGGSSKTIPVIIY